MRARLRLAACLLAAATVAGVQQSARPPVRVRRTDLPRRRRRRDGRRQLVASGARGAAGRERSTRSRTDRRIATPSGRCTRLPAAPSINVGRFWYRRGRRFVQVQVSTDDMRTLSKCALLSWSAYSLGPDDEAPDGLRFRQIVGPPAGKRSRRRELGRQRAHGVQAPRAQQDPISQRQEARRHGRRASSAATS